jgi:hypothetical protein
MTDSDAVPADDADAVRPRGGLTDTGPGRMPPCGSRTTPGTFGCFGGAGRLTPPKPPPPPEVAFEKYS